MGEEIGRISGISRDRSVLTVSLSRRDIVLNNGDGFSFVSRNGDVCGFRGDVCDGNSIKSRPVEGIYPGATLYRNINAAFEKELDRNSCTRMLDVTVSLDFDHNDDGWSVRASASSEDGRKVSASYNAGCQDANNLERMQEMVSSQISKNTGIYSFRTAQTWSQTTLPFMSASFLNSIRRDLAEKLDAIPCNRKDLLLREIIITDKSRISSPQKKTSYKNNISNRLAEKVYHSCGAESVQSAYELCHTEGAELMRTRYCVRYELGLCPKHHGCREGGPLYLLNNGQRFVLRFDCMDCEMTLSEA